MPNRILREGILTSPRIARLGWPEEVFYRRLMSVVDDFGRYYADAGMLRAACYPRQLNKVSDSDIGKWLQNIADAALVRVYPAQDGERYLQMLDFRQQTRATKSKFPDMPSECVADAAQPPSKPPADAHVYVFGDGDASEEKKPDAVAPAGKPALDLTKAELWEAGKSLLLAAGVPKGQCGSFVGKLVADYGDAVVVEAVRAAVVAGPADPKEYLKATCMRLKGERGADHGKPLTVPSAAAEHTKAQLAQIERRNAEVAAVTPEQKAATAERLRQARAAITSKEAV